MFFTIPRLLIYQTLGLCLLISVQLIRCDEIHEQVNTDEGRKESQTKQRNGDDKVKVQHELHKRAASGNLKQKSKSYDKDVENYLNPDNSVLFSENTPVWLTKDNRSLKKFKNGVVKRALEFYEKNPARAAMVVRARQDANSNLQNTAGNGTSKPRYPSLRVMLDTNRVRRGVTKMRMKKTDTVYPTILATTDFNLPTKSDNETDYYEQIIYQMAFWNAVDMRYRQLKDPKVRLIMAGIVIGTNREATPYVHNHTTNGEVQVFSILADMGWHWLHVGLGSDLPREAYHIVATATNLKLANEKEPGFVYSGIAATGSFCSVDGDIMNSIMLFRDDLSFGKVPTAAHELGHVLGLYHDNGTEGICGSKDGYLMTPVLSTTENNLRWSNCSLEKISILLREHDCADRPREYRPIGKPLGKILPGTLKTANEQCQGRGFDWACKATPTMCRNLECWNSDMESVGKILWRCIKSWAPADGTECGRNRVCLDGECRSLYRSN